MTVARPIGVLPCEVFHPCRLSWIEQSHHLTGIRIQDSDPITLVSIAERACEPEVRFFCRAAQRLGNNMVDHHRCADNSLLRQAVAAPMARGSGNEIA
jgi:hypothetical protein